MIKFAIFASAAAALLLASPAQANHCDADIAEAELMLAAPATDDANKLDAAEALLDQAIELCAQEHLHPDEVDAEGLPVQPDHGTIGIAILINALELTQGN